MYHCTREKLENFSSQIAADGGSNLHDNDIQFVFEIKQSVLQKSKNMSGKEIKVDSDWFCGCKYENEDHQSNVSNCNKNEMQTHFILIWSLQKNH